MVLESFKNSSAYINSSFAELLLRNQNKLALFCGLLFIILLTVVLNAFILLEILVNKNLRSCINIQYASMAASDLLVGAIPMTFLLISTLYSYWPLDDVACMIWNIFDFFGCNVSSLNLVAIAYYHLKAIKKPTIQDKTLFKRNVISIAFIWLVPFIFWTTSIVAIEVNYKHSTSYMDPNQCYFMYKFEYVLLFDITFYLSPAVALIILQILIFHALRKHKNKIQPVTRTINQTTSIFQVTNATSSVNTASIKQQTWLSYIFGTNKRNENRRSHNIKLEKDEKAFRVLLVVSTSFLILWSPWIIIWPIEAYCSCVPNWFYETSYWMQYSNSLVNSILLLIRHEKLRKKFLQICKLNNKK